MILNIGLLGGLKVHFHHEQPDESVGYLGAFEDKEYFDPRTGEDLTEWVLICIEEGEITEAEIDERISKELDTLIGCNYL